MDAMDHACPEPALSLNLMGPEQSPLELISMVRTGIPWDVFERVLKGLRIPQKAIAESLDIPLRTLSRRKKEGALSPEESNKLIRLSKVVTRCGEVFEDPGLALNWLQRPNRSMDGATPLSLLDTDIGAELVLDTLGRIERGIFA